MAEMTPSRLHEIETIFDSALECERGEVKAYLESACAGDELLRQKVEALLSAYQRSVDFIETPPAVLAARVVESEAAGTNSMIGRAIGHYKIIEHLATGGMGEVYLAVDTKAERKAALKLLPARFTADAERIRRFEQEARAVVALNHPNIVTIYEIGEEDSTHYIVSELVEGETLRQRLLQQPLKLREALEIAVQVASALSVAHGAGIVHRDIKPENVMLRPDGYVKVLDFGIAKLSEQPRKDPGPIRHDAAKMALHQTRPGLVLGTGRYMSPEQTRGENADARTDIWSLGVVIYEMVAGVPPFQGETPSDCIASILMTEPSPLSNTSPDVPLKLESILKKALRKNKDARYQTSKEMLADLRNLKGEMDAEGFRFQTRTRPEPRSPEGGTPNAQKRGALVALAAVVAVLGVSAPFVFRSLRTHPTSAKPASNLAAPEKSIAVLPFENLSRDPDNAFFADGVQDEILTDLARIAELKVIGRTSVMQYKAGVARNVRKIGQQLGVAHLVEGSVQRSGSRVRVNAQLVDARTDRNVWALTYERDLADVFAIQSDIAKAIADQLQAKLSPRERSEIERPPTNDVAAFNLYAQANSFLLTKSLSNPVKENLLLAIDLLNQAVARDPAFFQAYCQLAWAHGVLYALGLDHTSGRLALAEGAVQAASHLCPDAAETHLARAWYVYQGYLDYDGALAELEVARRTLPNDRRVFQLMGYIQRRLGHWEESTRSLERAVDLDPRDFFGLQQMAAAYAFLRRYNEQKSLLDRAMAIEPDHIDTQLGRAYVELDAEANPRSLHQTVDLIRATKPHAMPSGVCYWLTCALAERDTAAAREALIALGENPLIVPFSGVRFNHSFVEGVIARMTNDDSNARLAFTTARTEQEKIIHAQPNYGPAVSMLGLIDAGLGRTEEALREGRRGIELVPVGKDAMTGPIMVEYLAMIAAWVGNKDLAFEQLAIASRAPSGVSYGQLKLMPWWDPLRGDPRFEKIVNSLAPR
jgi:serine/threonine protein kinase/tetratricopeptide (TPR) repeat protein